MATAGEATVCKVQELSVVQLKNWLLEHGDVGEDFKEDIEILAGEKYNGKQFLKLDKEMLNDLKVSKGFRGIVLDIIEVEVQKTKKQENNFFFCMTGFKNRPVKTQAAPQNPSTSAAAWIPQLKDGKPAVWRFTGTDQCKKLKVKFIHDQDFSPVKYDTKLILEWANEWNDHGRDKSIPFFVEAKNEEKAQIRVKLNDKGSRWSKIGREAESDEIDKNEATMELDIHTGLPAGMQAALPYMKYLVMHEFGHALGLGHEHQRSDFWSRIIDFIDIEKMKSSIRRTLKPISDPAFESYWDEQWSAEVALVAGQTKYDRQSVMHYWFLKEWFDWSKYDKSRDGLNSEIVTTMDAIKNSEVILADQPSQQDIRLLREYYGTTSVSAGPPGPTPVEDNDEQVLTQNDVKKLMEKLGRYSSKWRGLGTALGFLYTDLDTIEGKQALMMDAPRSYLENMLNQWVMWPNDDYNAKPTLDSLYEAVRSTHVGLGALANKLKESF